METNPGEGRGHALSRVDHAGRVEKEEGVLFEAVMFDLDGTLLDTLEDLGGSVNRVLANRNLPVHPLEAYRNFVGDGARMLVERALPREMRSEEAIQTILEAFLDEYGRNWNVKTRPYPGVESMLDETVRRKVKIAVLSNKPHAFTQQCVRELLSRWRFDAIVGSNDRLPKKPHPAGALEVAEFLHVPPGRVLYLGDSGVDMKTAVAAGMYPAGALWGFRSREELVANGAEVVIEHPQEVVDFLT